MKQKQNISSPRYGDLGGDLLMCPHQLLHPHVPEGLLPASPNIPPPAPRPTEAGHRVDRLAVIFLWILHVVMRLPALTGRVSPGILSRAQNCHLAPLVSAAKNKPALLLPPSRVGPTAARAFLQHCRAGPHTRWRPLPVRPFFQPELGGRPGRLF